MRRGSGKIRRIASATMLGLVSLLIVLTVVFSFDKKEIMAYQASGRSVHITLIQPMSLGSLLNSGDLKALDALPGIGEVLAQRIIDLREQQGPYRIVEDLLNVKGIGSKKMAAIREYLSQQETSPTDLMGE